MAFPVDYNDLKNDIKNGKLTNSLYMSKEFYATRLGVVLLSTLEDLISYADNEGSTLISKTESEWLEFLSVYYKKFHTCKNTFKFMIRGDKISVQDMEEVRESLIWVFDVLISIFRKEKNEQPHIFNAIFGGKFYSSFFYYSKTIDSYCEKKLNLPEKYIESRRVIDTITQEREYIDNTEIQIRNIINDKKPFPFELQQVALGLWLRAADFVNGEVPTEKHKIQHEVFCSVN